MKIKPVNYSSTYACTMSTLSNVHKQSVNAAMGIINNSIKEAIGNGDYSCVSIIKVDKENMNKIQNILQEKGLSCYYTVKSLEDGSLYNSNLHENTISLVARPEEFYVLVFWAELDDHYCLKMANVQQT